jgi:hypothetical protein
MNWPGKTLVLVAGFVAVVIGGCSGESASRVTIAFHYSRFAPEVVTVPAGVPVILGEGLGEDWLERHGRRPV